MLDYELSRLLLSLVLLLSAALIIGHIFNMLGLPRVIGEICAGLILGPSLFGFFFPSLFAWIFLGFPEQKKMLSVFYWLGLILLMFTAGFKISATVSKKDRRIVLMLILGGIGLPFMFGLLVTQLLPNTMSANPVAFALVIATASAVTSIPVLSRIFLDLHMLPGRFAEIVLSAAAIQDIFLWVVVSIALAAQQGLTGNSASFYDTAQVVSGTFVFTAATLFLVPAILRFTGRLVLKTSPEASLVGYSLLVCLILVSIASVLRVNIVFGALLAGVAIGRLQGQKLERVKQSITNLAIWFFVPIYFAMVGLQINLLNNFDHFLILGFFLTSSLVKVISIVFAARFADVAWRNAFDFGITMNARGGPGIVLASLAYAAMIIDEELFVALVFTSIFTSLIAGYWLKVRRNSIDGLLNRPRLGGGSNS